MIVKLGNSSFIIFKIWVGGDKVFVVFRFVLIMVFVREEYEKVIG